jgi:hypothetical protein
MNLIRLVVEIELTLFSYYSLRIFYSPYMDLLHSLNMIIGCNRGPSELLLQGGEASKDVEEEAGLGVVERPVQGCHWRGT